jgi:glycosyltransferase involved in cell wall biosynthesis
LAAESSIAWKRFGLAGDVGAGEAARASCVSGADAAGLEGMAEFLGLKNVRFRGFSDDVTAIWRENHALVLPSRAEGLPLAQVEAMICGRVCIMCPAGGAGEILEDGTTGFVASASTPDALDEAMERAWAKREEWPEIGRNASASVWRYFPHDPCAVLADKLEAML